MVRTQGAPSLDARASSLLRVTQPPNCLPDVFVVGAAKSGTTALYRFFELHPQVLVPASLKETNFMAFDGGLPPLAGPRDRQCVGHSVTSLEAYRQLYVHRAGEVVAADVSPAYLYYPQASQRIAELAPRAKIVIVLRNPIDCVLSMYAMMRRDGREPSRSLLEAFRRSDERVAAGWEWAWDYKNCFKFAEQVARYVRQFPSGQLFIRRYEDLQFHPERFYSELTAFLGISPVDVGSANRRVNVAPRRIDMLTRKRAGRALRRASAFVARLLPGRLVAPIRHHMELPAFRLNQAARRTLVEHFRSDVVELSRRLDWDLREWLRV